MIRSSDILRWHWQRPLRTHVNHHLLARHSIWFGMGNIEKPKKNLNQPWKLTAYVEKIYQSNLGVSDWQTPAITLKRILILSKVLLVTHIVYNNNSIRGKMTTEEKIKICINQVLRNYIFTYRHERKKEWSELQKSCVYWVVWCARDSSQWWTFSWFRVALVN